MNQGIGSQSAFIREYNNAQADARTGEAVTEELMNKISNDMAHLLWDDIQNGGPRDGETDWSPNTVPDIAALAQNDAAAEELFGAGNLGGWAGNPLFLALGYKAAFYENITGYEVESSTFKPKENGAYDAFAMIKFSLASFQTGNIWDAITQFYNYPEARFDVADAARNLDAFLENE